MDQFVCQKLIQWKFEHKIEFFKGKLHDRIFLINKVRLYFFLHKNLFQNKKLIPKLCYL